MNAAVKRKAGRRASDKMVEVMIDPSVMLKLKDSPGLEKAAPELLAGRYVRLSLNRSKDVAPPENVAGPEGKTMQNTNKLVTMLAGGTTLGLAALAVAPASLIGAVIAAGVGVVLGNAATRLDSEETASVGSEHAH